MSKHVYLLLGALFLTLSLYAQPVVTGLVPKAHAHDASLTGDIAITFSEPMAAPAGDALRVHGSQSGRLGGSLSGGGTTTLRFQPDKSLKPGEQVTVTLTTAARSAAGLALARPFTYSFTARAAPAPVTFGPLQHLSAPGPVAVETADFDGDGDVDIVSVAQYAAAGTLHLNNGAGLFNLTKTLPPIYSTKTGMCVADFDGDGAMDIGILASSTEGGDAHIFRNDGQGNFTTSSVIPALRGANDIQAEDLNGDGAVDVTIVHDQPGTITVSINDGSGTFLPPLQYSAIFGTQYLTLADFDGDGDVDIASNAPDQTGLNLNDGTGRFSATTTVAAGGYNMATGDLDGDGSTDLVTHAGFSSAQAVFYLNLRVTRWPTDILEVGPQPTHTQLGDLDGDNDLDIVYALYGSIVSVKRNDGTDGTKYTSTPEILVGNPKPGTDAIPLCLSIADLDGDQDLDIVSGNVGTNNLSVLLNGGSQPGLSPVGLSFDHPGGSKPVAVAYTGAWTATGQDWLTVSPAGSTGSGTLTVTAAPNPAAESRTGTVTVTGNGASRTVSVTQAGAPATLSVSPGSLTYGPALQNQQLSITTNAIHTVAVDQPWLYTAARPDRGSRTVDFQAAANPDARPRSGTITVSGGGLTRTVAVTQDGAAPLLGVQPDYTVFAQPGGEQSLALTSNADWTVSQVPDWLSLSAAGGYRDASLTLAATANPTARLRRATLVFTAGSVRREAVVVQDGVPPQMAFSPNSLSFGTDSESKTAALTANVNWSVGPLPAWITVSPTSGTGNVTLSVTVAANALSTGRSASIRVLSSDGSEIETSLFVSQLRSSASPSSLAFAAKGGSQPFALTYTGTGTWSLSTTDNWLQMSPAGGNADAMVSVTASANPAGAPRSGKVMITFGTRTQTVFVTQEAAALAVTPAGLDFAVAGETGTLAVSSNRDWLLSGGAEWLTVNSPVTTGNATVTLTAAANDATSARTATLAFTAGNITRTVALNQPAAPARLAVSSPVVEAPAAGAEATVQVHSNTAWSAGSDQDWIRAGTAGGTGNGPLALTIAPNAGVTPRTGTVRVSSGEITLTVEVRQAAAPVHLSVRPTDVAFSADRETITLRITSNTDWQLGPLPGWLEAGSSSGSGNQEVALTAGANAATQARSDVFAITAGGLVQEIRVRQAAARPLLSVTPEALAFPAAGATRTLAVRANVDWQVDAHPTWVVVTPSADKITFQVTATANSEPATRTGSLTLTGGGLTATVSLDQEAVVPYLRVSRDSLAVVAEGSVQTIEVASNQSWRVEVPAGWLTADATAGKGNATLAFTAAPNETPEPRNCRIAVTAGALSQQAIFYQAAPVTVPATADLVVAPNPARSTLTVRLGEQPGEMVEAQLFNSIGQVVALYQLPVVAGKVAQALPVGTLPRGLYILQVHAAGLLQQRKVLLQ